MLKRISALLKGRKIYRNMNKAYKASSTDILKTSQSEGVLALYMGGSFAKRDILHSKSDIDYYLIVNSLKEVKPIFDKIAAEVSASGKGTVEIFDAGEMTERRAKMCDGYIDFKYFGVDCEIFAYSFDRISRLAINYLRWLLDIQRGDTKLIYGKDVIKTLKIEVRMADQLREDVKSLQTFVDEYSALAAEDPLKMKKLFFAAKAVFIIYADYLSFREGKYIGSSKKLLIGLSREDTPIISKTVELARRVIFDELNHRLVADFLAQIPTFKEEVKSILESEGC
ncbi:MAG: hypothetical protein ABIG95_01890 [Candidatus Woesearchaeota archaeon]